MIENLADIEALRRQYRPDSIRVLFIGESPPAGGTFFYAANSNLYRHTRDAFARVYTLDPGKPFLQRFQTLGCYLDDLCLEPVNHLSNAQRRAKYQEYAPALTDRLRKYQQQALISVKKSIEGQVRQAASRAGLQDRPLYSLPFPAMGHQHRFVSDLAEIVGELIRQDVLPGK